MKTVLILVSLLFLTGCATSKAVDTIRDRYHVIIAPSSMYNCPVVTVYPKIETLTDLETARLLVRYAENNAICKASLDKLRQFYANAKRRFET